MAETYIKSAADLSLAELLLIFTSFENHSTQSIISDKKNAILKIQKLDPKFFEKNMKFVFEKTDGELRYVKDSASECLPEFVCNNQKANPNETRSLLTISEATQTGKIDWADDIVTTPISSKNKTKKNSPKRTNKKPKPQRSSIYKANQEMDIAISTMTKMFYKMAYCNYVQEEKVLSRWLTLIDDLKQSKKNLQKSRKFSNRPRLDRKALENHCVSFVKRQKCKFSDCKYIHDVNPPTSVVNYVRSL